MQFLDEFYHTSYDWCLVSLEHVKQLTRKWLINTDLKLIIYMYRVIIYEIPFWCRNKGLKSVRLWDVRSSAFFCFSPQLCETWFSSFCFIVFCSQALAICFSSTHQLKNSAIYKRYIERNPKWTKKNHLLLGLH